MRQRRRSERAKDEHALGIVERSCFSESKRLPTGLDVLSVMLYRIKKLKESVPSSANFVIGEAFRIYATARIPTKDKSNACRDLVKFYWLWHKFRKFKRTSGPHVEKINSFKASLNNYFPLHHHNWRNTVKIQEDRMFLEQQMEPGRKGYISVPDPKFIKREQQILARNTKANMNRERMNSNSIHSAHSVSSSESDEDVDNGEDNFDEFKLRLRGSVPECPKPKSVVTPLVAASLDWAKLSDRKAVGVIGATLLSSGQSLDDFALSRSTIKRQRQQQRPQIVATIKAEMDKKTPLLLHFDGKLLPSLSGREKEDRVAVHVSAGDFEQLLGVPKVAAGTGILEAEAAHSLVVEWGLTTCIKGVVFDTTAVNTGIWNGALVILQRLLCTILLFLACRHHVSELVLKAAYEFCMGDMKCSEVAIFNTFRKEWPDIKKDSFETGLADSYVKKLVGPKADDIILFCEAQLKERQPRGDYKHLLILTIIFLGGVPPGGVQFYEPPATNDARWMNRAIYALLLFMFKKQFELDSQEHRKGLKDLCVFIVTVYVRYWYTCPVAAMAPLNDLNLLKQLTVSDRRRISSVLRIAKDKFVNHLWYLGEELVGLAFLDDRVPVEMKSKMLESLKSKTSSGNNLKRFENYENVATDMDLSDFVSQKSMILFETLQLPQDFLEVHPKDWENSLSYKNAKRFVGGLKVVNDTAERGIALMTEYNNILTHDEDQKQYVLQLVSRFRKLFPHQSKSELKTMSANFV